MKRKPHLDILPKLLNYNDEKKILQKFTLKNPDYLQRHKNRIGFRLLRHTKFQKATENYPWDFEGE